jgi:hypothetical protein
MLKLYRTKQAAILVISGENVMILFELMHLSYNI